MTDFKASVGDSAGVIDEDAEAFRIIFTMKDGKESNFFFLDDSLVSICFSRSLVRMRTFPVKESIW